MLLFVENWEKPSAKPSSSALSPPQTPSDNLELAVLLDQSPSPLYGDVASAALEPWACGGATATAVASARNAGRADLFLVFLSDATADWGRRTVTAVAGGLLYAPGRSGALRYEVVPRDVFGVAEAPAGKKGKAGGGRKFRFLKEVIFEPDFDAPGVDRFRPETIHAEMGFPVKRATGDDCPRDARARCLGETPSFGSGARVVVESEDGDVESWVVTDVKGAREWMFLSVEYARRRYVGVVLSALGFVEGEGRRGGAAMVRGLLTGMVPQLEALGRICGAARGRVGSVGGRRVVSNGLSCETPQLPQMWRGVRAKVEDELVGGRTEPADAQLPPRPTGSEAPRRLEQQEARNRWRQTATVGQFVGRASAGGHQRYVPIRAPYTAPTAPPALACNPPAARVLGSAPVPVTAAQHVAAPAAPSKPAPSTVPNALPQAAPRPVPQAAPRPAPKMSTVVTPRPAANRTAKPASRLRLGIAKVPRTTRVVSNSLKRIREMTSANRAHALTATPAPGPKAAATPALHPQAATASPIVPAPPAPPRPSRASQGSAPAPRGSPFPDFASRTRGSTPTGPGRAAPAPARSRMKVIPKPEPVEVIDISD